MLTAYGPFPVPETHTENAAHEPHDDPTVAGDESVQPLHGRMVSVVLNWASS